MSTTKQANGSSTDDNQLDRIGGKDVDTLLVIAGEVSMPDDRKEAVQEIDEAVVASPYNPTNEVRFRGQTNHEDAMKMWVQARQKVDVNFDASHERFGVDWPEDVDRDDDEWAQAVSDAFDERNEAMAEDVDATVIVTDGANEDYLGDLRSLVDDRFTYDHSVSIDSIEDAQDALGL